MTASGRQLDSRLPEFFRSLYSCDKAKRESIAWHRGGTCPDGARPAMLGHLDGSDQFVACTECGAGCYVSATCLSDTT